MSVQSGNTTLLPALRAARGFRVALIAVVYPTVTFIVPAARPFALPSAYILVAGLALFVVIAFRLMVAGGARMPLATFIAGAVFVGGGAAFDVIATLLHSPDLSNEANPVARFLLDSGHSVTFVLVYGALCQTLLTIGSIFLWGALLSQRVTIVDSVRDSSPTFPKFMKAILGGANKSWKQIFFPRLFRYHGDRSARYFYTLWVLAALLVGGAGFRWYLGLEWFGFSPLNREFVGVASMLLGLAGYFAWTWRAVQRANDRSAIAEAVLVSDGPVMDGGRAVEMADDPS